MSYTVSVAFITNLFNPFCVIHTSPKFLVLFSLSRALVAKSLTGCVTSGLNLEAAPHSHILVHTHKHTDTQNQNGGFLLSVFY